MKAAILDAQKTIRVHDMDLPEWPTEGGGLVRVSGCGICGSDLDKLLHRDVPTGQVLGHEVVGTIEALSPEIQEEFPHLTVGTRVTVAHHVPCELCYYCRHGSPSMCRAFKQSNIHPGGFSEYITLSKAHLAHTVFPLPEGITDAEASCIEPLACCIRAVDRIPETIGKNALVIGLGFIGLMTSQYFGLTGYQTFGVELQTDRVNLAIEHEMIGFATTDQKELLERISQETDGRGVDVVFLTIVNQKTLSLAFDAVRDGGTLVLFTSYGQNMPILDQNALYFREINVITSYSPSLESLRQGYHLITQRQIAVAPLITHRYPLSQLPEAMSAYQNGEALKVFIEL